MSSLEISDDIVDRTGELCLRAGFPQVSAPLSIDSTLNTTSGPDLIINHTDELKALSYEDQKTVLDVIMHAGRYHDHRIAFRINITQRSVVLDASGVSSNLHQWANAIERCDFCQSVAKYDRRVTENDGYTMVVALCAQCNQLTDAGIALADEMSWPDSDSGQRPWLHTTEG